MRNTRIVILVALALCLLASNGFAFGEIRYTDRPLNLRDDRSPKAGWIGNMYPGQKVRVDHLKDGWVAVFEPNATDGRESAAAGYANIKYLKKERTRYEPMEWGELKYAARALNVRSKPDVSGRKVMTLKSWEHVIVDFPEGDWVMVFDPDATIRSRMNGIGWSSSKYFRTAADKTMASVGFDKKNGADESVAPQNTVEPVEVVAEPSPADMAEVVSGEGQVSGSVAPPPAEVEFVEPVLVETTLKINVREGRTSGSDLVRTLKPGERMKVGQPLNGWYAVFGEYERVHQQSQPMGYALQSLVDNGAKEVTPRNAPPVSASVVPKLIEEPVKPAPKPVAKAPEPAPAPKPEPVAPKAAPAPVPAPKKAQAPAPKITTSDKGQQTMVINRKAFVGKKRPDPTPDKSAHGYQYRFLEKSETRKMGEAWITLKVFLATSKQPDRKALEDFATTLWKEHKRVTKKVAVLIYLPGMDTEDLAYGVVKFDNDKLLELWVRRATLFGTKFL